MNHLAGNIHVTPKGNLTIRKINRQFVQGADHDTATTKHDIEDGHKRYQEHIRRTRERLGLVDSGIHGCDDRVGE